MKAMRVFAVMSLVGWISVHPGEALAKTKRAVPLKDLELVEGDERGNEIKSLKAEMLVSRSETKAISQIKKLLIKHKGTVLEPDLQFRLAELYMRRSKTDRFFEIHRQSETVVSLAPRKLLKASSQSSLRLAIESYSLIQKKFPSYSQMDLVLFNQAFAHQALNEETNAEKLYLKLIASFSRSYLVPDAHLAVGEIEFNRGQFKNALAHFYAIEAFPNSRVYPYGLYKSAWTHYNLRDGKQGLKKLEEVVAFGRRVEKEKLDSRLDLRKEALNDMTLFFEDVYPAKEAYSYFYKQAGEQEVGQILLRMANLYARHSRYSDQQVVLDRFVLEMKDSPLLPDVHRDLVLAYDHLRKKDLAVERLEAFRALCTQKKEWLKSCQESLNETSLKLARKWLKAWRKLVSDPSYAEASEQSFAIYLKTAPPSKEYSEARFTYAELLFSRNKFRQASENYAEVQTHDASYAAVLSLEKAVDKGTWSDSDEKSFHKLAGHYIKNYPKGKFRPDVEYKLGLMAYERSKYDEAAPIFLSLGKAYPKHEKGLKAQDLYLDILNIKKDYKGIRVFTHSILAGTTDGDRKTKLKKLNEQAFFLEAQSVEERGDLEEALKKYVQFTKTSTDQSLTEKAIWNTFQLQVRLGQEWAGAQSAEKFADKYPAAKEATNALLTAAQTYENMGQLEDAARVLEKLAARDAKSRDRWMELAGDFLAIHGNAIGARRVYRQTMRDVPTSKSRVLAKLEVLEKTYGSAESHQLILQTMISSNIQPQANLAKVEMVERLFDSKKYSEAFDQAKRYLGAGLENSLKARLRFVQAQILMQEFYSASVKARAEKVATVLAIKTEKLDKAQTALQTSIKYGNPKVSVKAFEALYDCYAHYVEALRTMPTPKGLSEADEQVFRSEISNLVIPLEEKGVEALAQAVEFARKQKFLDDSLSRLENRLARVNQTQSPETAVRFAVPDMALPLVAGVGR